MKYSIITSKKDNLTPVQLSELQEYTLTISSDDNPQTENELILGNTERVLSDEAKKTLVKALSTAPDGYVGYSIMKKNGSVAAVWSDFSLSEAAISHVAQNIEKMNNGYTFADVFPLTSYLKERGEKLKDKKWKLLKEALGDKHGEKIVKELRELYSLFDERIVTWLAKLYDAEHGGWYFTNSARDTEGFLPDIESTYGALRYPAITGMYELYDNKWELAIPEWLKKRVVDFIYPMQDEDGFFYHPQWPKEYIIEKKRLSKISRDKGWAKYIFSHLGITPRYNFEGKSDTSSNQSPLTAHYSSPEAFKKHLEVSLADGISNRPKEEVDKRARVFYSLGNSFQSNAYRFKENPELRAVYADFFNSTQNKLTGTWGDTVCYNATNALHKIASTYNMIGLRMNYIDEMVETVFKILSLTSEQAEANGAVDIYNAWSCFPYIYENILKYGDGDEAERRAKKDAIKERVLEFAPKGIAISREQISHFKREDGSFSYSRRENCSVIQGCLAAVAHTSEGDVNGNTICTVALKQHIFRALEVGEYEVPIFTEYERRLFMNILEESNSSYENQKQNR